MRLDIRWPIGALLAVTGAILVVFGLTSPPALYAKSLGININLWWGTAMVAIGGVLLALVFWGISFLPVTSLGLVALWREGLSIGEILARPPQARRLIWRGAGSRREADSAEIAWDGSAAVVSFRGVSHRVEPASADVAAGPDAGAP